MTKLERERDALLVAIAKALADQGAPIEIANDLNMNAQALEIASAKQHDSDRNAVRRAMQLEDCPEASNSTLEVIHVGLCRDLGDDPSAFWVAEYKPGLATEGKTIPEALRNLAEVVELAESVEGEQP